MLRMISLIIMLFSLLPVQHALADFVLGDITDEVQVRKAKKDNIIRTNKDSLDLFIKNKSDQSLLGPFLLVIKDISNEMLEVSNADGFDADGNPYFEFLQENEILKDNKKTERREILFINELKEKFEFTVSVMGRIAHAVEEVGPDGGVVGIEGEITLTIPEGAVDEESRFIISKSTDFPSEPPGNNVEAAYELISSHGDTFNEDITICFSYDPYLYSPTELETLRLYYFNEDQPYWAGVDSFLNEATSEVCAYVDHFSYYIMSVTADPVLLEDWDMPDNSAGWWQPNGSVANNQMEITFDYSLEPFHRKIVFLPAEVGGSDYLQGDIMLEDGAVAPGSRIYARIGGCWGNYRHASTAGWDGWDGNLYMGARIERRQNSDPFITEPEYRLICSAGKNTNPSLRYQPEPFWETLESGILPNTPYTAILRKTGNVLSCEIKDKASGVTLLSASSDVVASYDDVDYISEVGEDKNLQVRFSEGAGVGVGMFDNLYVATDVVPTVESAGQIWMDRNLGASRVATSPTDEQAYGDLYQWGRGADGHEKRTSSTTSELSTTDDPGHGDFILTRSSNDWRDPRNDYLWQGLSGINNPCPAGFRLPTTNEWDVERASWSNNEPADAFESPLKLVMAGQRKNEIELAGEWGRYWSSTTIYAGSYDLYFTDDYDPKIFIVSDYRKSAFSVRCIQD